MNDNDLRLVAFLLFVAALVFAALLASALLSEPQFAMTEEGFLEEIIITTQQREQSVQKMPVSVRFFEFC